MRFCRDFYQQIAHAINSNFGCFYLGKITVHVTHSRNHGNSETTNKFSESHNKPLSILHIYKGKINKHTLVFKMTIYLATLKIMLEFRDFLSLYFRVPIIYLPT